MHPCLQQPCVQRCQGMSAIQLLYCANMGPEKRSGSVLGLHEQLSSVYNVTMQNQNKVYYVFQFVLTVFISPNNE